MITMSKGFTLLEFLILVAIMEILSVIFLAVIPNNDNPLKDFRYEICSSGGTEGNSECKYVDSYNEHNGCVSAENTKFCGSYFIRENKK